MSLPPPGHGYTGAPKPDKPEKPGLAQTPKDLAEKVGTWVGLGLLVWLVVLGVAVVTVKVLQHLF